MSGGEITRRSLLAATAGALAAGAVRPAGTLARSSGAPTAIAPELFELAVGRLGAGAVVTVRLPRRADLVGVQWLGNPAARIALRTRDAPSGAFGPWVSAAAHGHAPDALTPHAAASALVTGDPVWTGGSTAVQLRCAETVGGVRLQLVDASAGAGARRLASQRAGAAGALALVTPTLPAGAGAPPIVARRAWAAGVSPPRVAPEYGAVRLAFVHHTENPNGYSPGEVPAMLRAIYAFHRFVHGWNDIGYNFVVDLYGRVFEARAGGVEEPVVGAQAGGYNLHSTGVAVLGSFTSVGISAPARAALERLLAWKLSLHGLPARGRVTVTVNPAGAVYSRFPANARVSLPRIAGHRDGDSTDCPGEALYGELPAIRAGVRRLAPRPTRVTLALVPVSPATTPTPTPPTGSTGAPGATGAPAQPTQPALAGSVTTLDGAPLAGAPVQLQARTVSRRGELVGERTLAEASTDAHGHWALALSALAPAAAAAPHAGGLSLRALYPGSPAAGAAVSDPLHLGAAALTPPTAPAPTPPAAPPPAA